MSIITSVSFLTSRLINPLLRKNNITNVVQKKRAGLNKNIDMKKNMNMNMNMNKNNITNRDIDIYSVQERTQEPIHNLFPKDK